MLKISNEKLYYDGYLVADLKDDIPPSIRDRFERVIEAARLEVLQCEECDKLYLNGT